MTEKNPERPSSPEPDGAGEQRKASEDSLADSLFPQTNTYFTAPALNKGVPRDPLPIRILSAVEIVAAVGLFALILVGVMYQVLGRYFPALSWVGAGELALLSMIALTFVTTGYLVARNGHIVLEIFDGLLEGKRLFAVLRIVSAVIMVATSIALAYEAFIKIDVEWTRLSAAMRIPLGMLYVFALVGAVSAAIHSIVKIPFAGRPERKLDFGEMEG